MTATEESEPLISSTNPAVATTSSGKHRFSYQSLISKKNGSSGTERNGSASPEVAVCLEKMVSGSSADRSLERITFTWSDVNVYVTAKKQRLWERITKGRRPVELKHILKDVSGVAYPGELLVIMGSSGAGKTTLLNTLTFRTGQGITVSGIRAANGRRLTSTVLTSRSAYVQQNDLFIGTLTVKEHLIFQALVRMDRHIPYRQRMQRVEEVIAELALTKCTNTVIGVPGRVKGISGGEMKRLSLASEYLTDPPLMFCDEPTSGLDSFMAHQVVTVLKNLTARGKTIVATLHQPSSELFALFDRILLMAEGRVAFMGSPEQACAFFKSLGAACPSNYNPADHFIQVLAVVPGREAECRQAINNVCDDFQKSETGVKMALEAGTVDGEFGDSVVDETTAARRCPYKASWCEQFRAVLWRSWISVIKEPMLIKVRFLQTIMVAMLIGFIYYGQKLDQNGVMNINGALFIFLTNMTFQNVFAVIYVFCAELPIFLREHRNGMYRTDVYFICKTLAEAPVFIAVPFVYTAIVYPMIGMYPGPEHFFTTAGIVTLVANVATSFGYLISCVSSNVAMASAIAPPLIIPFLLFGGFFLNKASVPSYFVWFSYLSWFRYGNEALLVNQWAEVDSISCTRSNETCPKNGHVILQTLNFSEHEIGGLVLSCGGHSRASRPFADRSSFKPFESCPTASCEGENFLLPKSIASHVACSRSVDLCKDKRRRFRLQENMVVTSRGFLASRNEDSTQCGKGVTISWRDLSVYATTKDNRICKQLINNVRGAVKSGTLVAIMGGSGAGKSSLMTALAYRSPPGVVVHGDILVQGHPVSPSYMRLHTGFMHQEDLFVGSMTVMEHLMFMARMKLDRRTEVRNIRIRISRLLQEVGLVHRSGTQIGTGGEKVLSGGEKKRLAFATELISDPKILFLDEPTTGLDAHSAGVLVAHLKAVASRGRTVLCTIHQPSSAIFNAFQQIILVAEGRIAFIGTGVQALQFFASEGHQCPCAYNPADFLIATLATAPRYEDASRRNAQRICDAFLVSDASKENDLIIQLELHISNSYNWTGETEDICKFKEPWWWTKLYWLINRGTIQVIRDPSVQLLRILLKLCLAILVSLCFFGAIKLDQLGIQAVQGVLFILVTENTFLPMYATLATLPQEMPLFLREHRAGLYSPHLYYLARVISLIPGLIIEPIIFVMIVYWVVGLRSSIEAFTLSVIVVIFTMNVSTACGCFFSAAFDSVPLAMAYLVPFDYILMVTMGPFIKLGTLPAYVQWVKYISWLLHSTEALTIVQWDGVHNISCEVEDPELPCMTDGSEVLDRYDFDADNYWTDISFMAVTYVVFHCMGYACLWNRARYK
ncbi:ABC multidrug transporter H-like [Diprion similis]|uniref:ABC multidrug transporter H-like n=1 Tax=Diprion similis TaxID=362088 RepID=UPI001EF75FB2|nr:ABC multidrug transporter H-like [Diprion similis]